MATGKKFTVQAQKEIRIVLESLSEEGYTGLTHIFRQPTAADKVAYYQEFSSAEISGEGEERQVLPRFNYWGAVNLLYDRCILAVEDYTMPESLDNWQDFIPFEHKLEAIELLFKKLGMPLKVGKAKN